MPSYQVCACSCVPASKQPLLLSVLCIKSFNCWKITLPCAIANTIFIDIWSSDYRLFHLEFQLTTHIKNYQLLNLKCLIFSLSCQGILELGRKTWTVAPTRQSIEKSSLWLDSSVKQDMPVTWIVNFIDPWSLKSN